MLHNTNSDILNATKNFDVNFAIDAYEEMSKKEYLAKVISYDIHSNDSIKQQQALLWLQNNGYSIVNISTDKLNKKGIYIDAVVPNDNREVIILSRGTQAGESTDASVIADLDPLGPAYQYFQDSHEQVIHNLIKVFYSNPTNKLCFTGHSLGGALTLLILEKFLYLKQSTCKVLPEISNLSYVNKVVFVSFQGAGVNKLVKDNIEKFTKFLISQDKEFSISAIYARTRYDVVHKTGYYPFAKCNKDLANVALIKQDISREGKVKAIDILNKASQVFKSSPDKFSVRLFGAAKSSAILLGKYLKESISFRAKAHTTEFSVDKNGVPTGKLPVILTNHNQEDLSVIQENLTKNWVDNRFVNWIRKFVYGKVSKYDNEDIARVQHTFFPSRKPEILTDCGNKELQTMYEKHQEQSRVVTRDVTSVAENDAAIIDRSRELNRPIF